ncbi:dihydropteroate synthase [Methanocalculus taiwanensis]|uniref:dihydropteroate synthase n=1 Tax=Methanocalculus taiwanensis TaxID=106207 RepID=A0ABD4TLS8_9EURY|nr:dihydropteroate synthase [Methanocalculus taiwanensis]MCQ1539381.1 dihydropteroate synthase [Methanocalculus taiwanensis]
MRITRIGNTGIGGDNPVRLMGVINTSPESFFSGSFVPPGRVLAAAERMVESGAEIIDVGARSTAPGSRVISVSEECERLRQSLAELDKLEIPVSVDTMHAKALQVALKYEIDAINDIHGLADSRYADVAADSGLPVIAMAAVHAPGDARGADETLRALSIVLKRCEEHGITDLILDPGIGRWVPERTFEDDWEICRRFGEFSAFGHPLLGAISRKSFIGDLLGKSAEERLPGSLALTAHLIDAGADMIRTHDIRETADLILVCEKVRGRL